MKHGSDDMPIACCLTSAELREREATLLAQFRSAVIGSEELRDGYAFRIPGDGRHTFRPTFGMMPAELGEHQLTIRDYCGTAISARPTSICNRHRIRSATPRRDGYSKSATL